MGFSGGQAVIVGVKERRRPEQSEELGCNAVRTKPDRPTSPAPCSLQLCWLGGIVGSWDRDLDFNA